MAEQQAIGKALLISDDVIKRLDEADKKINKIAEDSDNMAKTFSSAMTKMGNDTSKFIEKLTSIQNKISDLDVSKFAKGVADVGKGVDQVEKFASAITRAAAAINKYNSAQSKNDISKQISALNKEIEALKKKTEQLQKLISTQNRASSGQASTRAENKAIDAYNRAMASSEAIVTQRINKIAKLRQAEEMLVKTGKDYSANISRIRTEIERLNKLNQGQVDAYGRVVKSQHNLMSTSDQLMGKLALVFSVSQIQGYIEKLIRVRGEFELHNTALASILQNKEKADLLFGQITELAVKSPFSVKELVTYTKTLSAYQVEYEKLYDTTKMLADVSAGLGVDMQRLILAFGQVKAANFLRGTETRQFTEAGINMLGELAKYYSELEGRIVSVSEVQDRQFKKMIAFKDVEEVLKRLTSAGGMFYNMQEKQAETLAGQVSNLQDSIDLMLNDIGTANQGALNGIITGIKNIIENWKSVARVIEPIATTLLLIKGSTMTIAALSSVWASVSTTLAVILGTIKKTELAQLGFNNAVKTNPYVLIGSLIVGAIIAVKNAIEATTEEQEKLNEISSQGYYNAISSAANYKRLAEIVSSSTASYQEQKNALDELKRTYSEILPQHYLEAEAIRNMKGNYDEATAAIMNYLRAKTQEKQLQAISEEYEGNVQGTQQDLANVIKNQIKFLYGFKVALSDINVVLAEFRKRYDEGLIKTEQEARDTLNKLLSERIGENISISMQEWDMGWFTGKLKDRLADYFNSLQELKTKNDEVIQQTNVQFGDKITLQLQEQKKQLDAQINEANSMLDLIATKFSGGAGSELITDKQISDAKAKLIEYANAWGIPEEKIKELKGGAYEISQISKEFNVAALKTFASEIGRMKLPTNQLASARKYLQDIQNEINGLNPTPLQKYVSNIILSVAQLNNVSLDGLVDAFARADENIGDYSKRIKGTMDTLTEQLNLYKKAPMLTGWTAEDAKNAEKKKKVLEAVYKGIIPDTDKDIKKRQAAANKAHKSELDKLKERIELIKKVGEEYKKLLDYYDKGTAKQKVIDAFSDSFKDVGLSIDMDFDISGVIKKIGNLTNKAGKEGAKAINEALAPLKSERDIELQTQGIDVLKKKLDGMFAGYELSIELQKEGLDENLVEQLFNVDTFSLDDLKTKLAELEPELRKYGDKGVEVFKDADKKITDNEQKELNERLKKYSTYLKQSVTERVKIELEAQKQIAEVQATSEFTPQQKSSIINKIKEEAAKKKDEQTWKDFQGTDLYIKMFEDLESASTKALDFMLSKLEGLRDGLKNLSPTELKEVISQMDKIQEISISRNPFKGFSENLKEVIKYQKEAKELNDEYIEAVRQQDLLKGMVESQQLATEEEKKRYNEIVKINGASSEEAQNAKENLTIQEELLDNLLKQLVAQGKITDELAEQIRKGEKQISNFGDRFNSVFNMASQTLGSVNSMLDDLGVEMNEDTREAFDGLGQIFTSLESMDFSNPISVITNTMSLIGGIGKIFGNGDAKYEKKIERQQILVESLQRSYEKLYDTIENGLSLDTYSQNAALIQNLQKQVDSYQAMIAAERDKKHTDNNKIRDWQNSIEDIYAQMDELYDNLKTNLVGDFRSVAEQLGDAIAEAFQKGEDAAEAWGESVNEIVAEIVQNFLVQKLIEPKVQEILDQMFEAATPKTNAAAAAKEKINSLQEEYAKLLQEQASGFTSVEQIHYWRKRKEELEKQIAELQKQYKELNAAAEGEVPNITQDIIDKTLGSLTELGDEVLNNPAWDMLKELLQGASGDTMSGLQKGIEGLSEETGQALEALLNSMRFYVADTNTDIKNIYNFLVNMPIESPLMQEMKVQSNYLSSINSLLNSVSKNVPSNGRALKVQIV